MGAPVPIDCQQSPAGFTLHCHRSRNTSVCLCQTRVSDSVAAKLAVNNTGCSAASQQRPARGVGVPSGQPRTVRPNCIYSPRTASFLSFIRACLLPQHGTRFSPFRPHLRPAAPGTRPRHAHAVHRSPHGTARTPQRQFLPPSDPQFPSIRSLEQAYLCFPNGRPTTHRACSITLSIPTRVTAANTELSTTSGTFPTHTPSSRATHLFNHLEISILGP